jgi:hypothetical protein
MRSFSSRFSAGRRNVAPDGIRQVLSVPSVAYVRVRRRRKPRPRNRRILERWRKS